MTPAITEFRNVQLRDYVDSLGDVGAFAIESDRDVFKLIAATDRFRLFDFPPFDFSNPDEEPTSEIMREIVTVLTAPENVSMVEGFHKRHCQDVAMNEFAHTVWSYVRAKTRPAEQVVPSDGHKPSSHPSSTDPTAPADAL